MSRRVANFFKENFTSPVRPSRVQPGGLRDAGKAAI